MKTNAKTGNIQLHVKQKESRGLGPIEIALPVEAVLEPRPQEVGFTKDFLGPTPKSNNSQISELCYDIFKLRNHKTIYTNKTRHPRS